MPSEKILSQKKQAVADIAEQLKNAVSGVVVDYTGISVEADTKLRAELRAASVHYSVKKNSLISRAATEAGLGEMNDVLKGASALAISDSDLVAPAKILAKFAEDHDSFKLKAGFIEGKVVGEAEIQALAKLPSKEVLVAKALGGLNAPISGFVMVLNANLRGLAVALNAIAEQKQKTA